MKKIILYIIFFLLINNFYVLSINIKNRHNKNLESFYLALSGIIMEDNESSHTELDAFTLDGNGKDNTKYALNRDWGIKNHNTCIKMLDSLFSKGHSAKLKKLLDYAKSYRYNENEIKKLNLNVYDTRRLLFVYEFLQYFNEKEMLYAWDIGRVVSVSRWCYHIGYLSEDEAWAYLEKAGKKLITIFDNWENYGANYVLGRIFWKAAFDDYKPLQYETVFLYYTLLDDKTGIWKKVSWPREKKTNRRYQFIENFSDVAKFYIAIKKDDVDSVKKIVQIDKEYYMNSVNQYDWPPVIASIIYKSNKTAKFLINNGFDLNARNPYNSRTPLMQALLDNNKEIYNLLIKNNVDLHAINDNKWTSLMYAIRYSEPDVIKNLINDGADVNTVNDNGWTPLMLSIRYSTPEIVKIILELDRNINATKLDGKNALDLALQYNTPEVINMILEHNPEVSVADSEDWTPLMYAIRYSTPEIINKILDAGAEVNTENNNNWTPLIFAIRYSTNEIIERLLKSNTKINIQTKDGWTPLHFAAYKLNLIIGEKLINLGCDPEALTNNGEKPIDLINNENIKKRWKDLVPLK